MFRVINGTKLFALEFKDPGGAICGVEKIRPTIDSKDVLFILRPKDAFFDEIQISLRELAKNGKWKIEGEPAGIFLEGVYRRLQNEIVEIPKDLCDYYNNPRSVFVYWPPLQLPEWINPQILTYLSDETPRIFRNRLQDMLEDDRRYWIDEEDLGKGRNKIWPKLRELPFSLAENLGLHSKKLADRLSGFEIRIDRLVNLANIACRAGRTLSPRNFLIPFKKIASWIWKMMIAPAKVIKIRASKIMLQTFNWTSYCAKRIKEVLGELSTIVILPAVTFVHIMKAITSGKTLTILTFRKALKESRELSSADKILVGFLLFMLDFPLIIFLCYADADPIFGLLCILCILIPICSVFMILSGLRDHYFDKTKRKP